MEESKMSGIVTNGVRDEGEGNEMNGNRDSPSKETLSLVKSPRGSSIPGKGEGDTANFGDDGVVEPSIEQLYENVCDMQSSDQSPSRQSFGSDGDESRIDSELRHLVGGRMREVEIMEEEVGEGKGQEGSSSSEISCGLDGLTNDTKLDDVNEIQEVQPAATGSGSSVKSVKASSSRVGPDASPKSTAKGKSPLPKPPIERKNGRPSKKQSSGGTGVKNMKNAPSGNKSVSQNRVEKRAESVLERPERAPLLLKQARDMISSGDNPHKALDLALQAMKLFEKLGDGKPSLELVMCLHVIAAIYCSLSQYGEAIPILERSIEIPDIGESQQHALAKFAGHMQLGDTYAMLGQLENSIRCYNTGLEVQKQVLGETDPRVGETCRYVAEANVQALQFDEAERLCQMALDIHKENNSAPSLEEAADRRLMGLVCDTKGNHEAALEHLVLASMAMVANGQEGDVAAVDCSIGDTYLSLSRYDEAIFAYQKALTAFKTNKGENHPAVGFVFVRLADLYNRIGKIRESKSYCESALKIYENPIPGVPPEEIASGLTNISTIYESMNELERALKLLQKALEIYNDVPGQQSTIAGIEAQMGVMYYMLGNYSESYETLKTAISKLRAIGEKKSSFFGIALNQMGLACVQRYALSEATELFEEAKSILEQAYGPYHPETLGVCSNLAGTYDAIGRYLPFFSSFWVISFFLFAYIFSLVEHMQYFQFTAVLRRLVVTRYVMLIVCLIQSRHSVCSLSHAHATREYNDRFSLWHSC